MINESDIRKYLSSLSLDDVANSVYLYGIDFNNENLDKIFESILFLYDEVATLQKIIQERFENLDETQVLTAEESAMQAAIIQDYHKKSNVLNKVLNNNEIYESIENDIIKIESKINGGSSRR